MSTEEKGLSFVPQINAAYDAVVKAEGSSLENKIKLGELLNLAKEAVGHGPWTAWLEKHCPKISHRSANVYMRLAGNKAKLTEAMKSNSQRAAIFDASSRMSIRQALNEIKTDEEKAAAEARAKKAKAKAAKLKRAAASVQIEDLLCDLAVDEVYTALKSTHEVGYLLELAHKIIEGNERKAPPPELDRRPLATAAPVERRA